MKWHYLEGDGDFRSAEVTALRDEADFIITNPPFSMFREFVAWIMEAGKKFAIIGNINAITYKEIFPLIKENKIWTDNPFVRGAGYFTAPYEIDTSLSYFNSHDYREGLIRVPGVRWYTNIELGRRHQPQQLMTMADNIRYSKHKEVKGIGYHKYDNYDAIDVPFTDAIPSDYDGKMGVPISWLDKFCPEQFDIIGNGDDVEWLRQVGAGIIGQKNIDLLRKQGNKAHVTANMTSLCMTVDGEVSLPYKRIIIRKK